MSRPGFTLTPADADHLAVAASRYLAGRADSLAGLQVELERIMHDEIDRVVHERLRSTVLGPGGCGGASTTSVLGAGGGGAVPAEVVEPRRHEPAVLHAAVSTVPVAFTGGDLVARRVLDDLIKSGELRPSGRMAEVLRKFVRGVELRFDREGAEAYAASVTTSITTEAP